MLVVAVLLCLYAASVAESARLCTAAGGSCVDICKAGNRGACAKGGLYAGLCGGSPTRRCCVPASTVTNPPATRGPTSNCLKCICKTMGCKKGCVGNVCGPFRISWGYWYDSGKPGRSYKSCTNNMACSRKCVVGYMKRYVSGPQTCERYARVHKSGPKGWQNWAATTMWNKVKACCAGKRGGC